MLNKSFTHKLETTIWCQKLLFFFLNNLTKCYLCKTWTCKIHNIVIKNITIIRNQITRTWKMTWSYIRNSTNVCQMLLFSKDRSFISISEKFNQRNSHTIQKCILLAFYWIFQVRWVTISNKLRRTWTSGKKILFPEFSLQ